MSAYPVSREAVTAKVAQWAQESALHFARLAKAGAVFENVTYPTGYRTVIAQANGEKAEVQLHVAKQLRAAGYKVQVSGDQP